MLSHWVDLNPDCERIRFPYDSGPELITSAELDVFDAVVRTGSFGQAAIVLGISQPAVSERIARLERRTSAQLFLRHSRGVRLTAAGEALVPFARSHGDLMLGAVAAVRRTAEVPKLVVASHSSLSAVVAPSVIEALGRLARRIEFRDAHSDEIVRNVAERTADIGFVVPSTLPRGISRHRLVTDPVVSVAAPGDELAQNNRVITFDDVAERALATNAWGSGSTEFDDLVAVNHTQPALRRNVPDPHTAIRLATDHGHIAFIARSAAEPELRAGRLVLLDLADMPDWQVDIDLIHPVGATDPAIRHIVDHFELQT